MEIHWRLAWWWVLVEMCICFCQVVFGTPTIWDYSKFSAWGFWPPACYVFRASNACADWFVVINSQQFHFPSHSAPLFEGADFSFRLMIKDTIFPVYFYFEDVAIWGLSCMERGRVSIKCPIIGGTLTLSLLFSAIWDHKNQSSCQFYPTSIRRVKFSCSAMVHLVLSL